MPCSMASIHVNRTEQNRELFELADKLTHALDVIRESILAETTPPPTALLAADIDTASELVVRSSNNLNMEREGPTEGVRTDADLVKKTRELLFEYARYILEFAANGKVTNTDGIEARQIAHRMEDRARLIRHFTSAGEMEMVIKVARTTVTKPLTPQLGFDPDEY